MNFSTLNKSIPLLLIVLQILLPLHSSESLAHPFHVSISLLDVDMDNKRIKCSHKIFLEDIENQLLERKSISKKITKDQLNEEIADVLQAYLNQNFTIAIGKNEPLTPTWLGAEIDFDILWIYNEYPIKRKIKDKIEAKSSILLDYFDDQMNIVHLNFENTQYSAYFNKQQNKMKELTNND